MRVRLLFKRSMLALGAGLVALGIAELSLRAFWPQGQVTDELRYEGLPGAAQSGPGYRLEPGQWIPGAHGGAVNQDGLRGDELGPKRGWRVLVLGDSFVFGAGVDADEALPAVLQLRGEAEFVNAGTPGYGTARELAWLESFGAALEPDEVLLCVFLGNDFTDNLSFESPRVVGGKLFAGGAADELPGWRLELRSWRSSLHLWRLFERRTLAATGAQDSLDTGAGKPGSDGRPQIASTTALDASERQQARDRLLDGFARHEASRLSVYLPESAPDTALARRVALAFDMTHLALEGIAAWCRQRGVELRVIAIPDVLAVDSAHFERALRLGDFSDFEGFDPAGLDLDRPAAALAEWCRAAGLPYLDLTPAFRDRTAKLRAEQPASEALYLFGDSHWNAAGHRFAAKLIATWRASLEAD